VSDGSLDASWRDHRDDRPADVPPVPGPDAPPFYLPIGEFQGPDYRRNAFAAGTDEELSALRQLVGLGAGDAVLDVGCGDARHLRAAARDPRGAGGRRRRLPGADRCGPQAAAADGVAVELVEGDARDLAGVLGERLGTFDVAWSLCQGGARDLAGHRPGGARGMAAAVRPGGRWS
jgi:hypothetical protein